MDVYYYSTISAPSTAVLDPDILPDTAVTRAVTTSSLRLTDSIVGPQSVFDSLTNEHLEWDELRWPMPGSSVRVFAPGTTG